MSEKKLTKTLNYTVPDDGVRFKATINPKRNIHDGVVFFYRPTDFPERKSFGYQITALQQDEKWDQAAMLEFTGTLSRVESWDIELTTDMFIAKKANLNAELFQDMYRVIWGFAGADELEVITKNS